MSDYEELDAIQEVLDRAYKELTTDAALAKIAQVMGTRSRTRDEGQHDERPRRD